MTTLSDIVQRIYFDIGQTESRFLATDGSTTTVTNSKWSTLDEQPMEDRNKNDYIVVARADGAAPEGEWSRITAYDASTFTYTFDAMTAAVASGDEVMVLWQSTFALMDVIHAINEGLRSLGKLQYTDTSITTASDQTEYDYPVALKGAPPVDVLIQTNKDSGDYRYKSLSGWKYFDPTTPGSAGTLYIPQQDSGYTILILADKYHDTLNDYNDVLDERIDMELITHASILKLLRRYHSQTSGEANYWLAAEIEYKKRWLEVKAMHPIYRQKRQTHGLHYSI